METKIKELLRRGNANRSKRKITRIHSIPQPERESKRKWTGAGQGLASARQGNRKNIFLV